MLGGAENIAGWENIPLAGRVEEAEGLKTLAGNDANMMALGETLFGAAKGATDVVFVTVGTGIGCGALIDGRLYRGYRNRGMEMGHITVKCDGEGCACGGVGCLEHYASTSALVRRFCELNGSAGMPKWTARTWFSFTRRAIRLPCRPWRSIGTTSHTASLR